MANIHVHSDRSFREKMAEQDLHLTETTEEDVTEP